jgi:hypothetical protein
MIGQVLVLRIEIQRSQFQELVFLFMQERCEDFGDEGSLQHRRFLLGTSAVQAGQL